MRSERENVLANSRRGVRSNRKLLPEETLERMTRMLRLFLLYGSVELLTVEASAIVREMSKHMEKKRIG